jgi:hypothetical protein
VCNHGGISIAGGYFGRGEMQVRTYVAGEGRRWW